MAVTRNGRSWSESARAGCTYCRHARPRDRLPPIISCLRMMLSSAGWNDAGAGHKAAATVTARRRAAARSRCDECAQAGRPSRRHSSSRRSRLAPSAAIRGRSAPRYLGNMHIVWLFGRVATLKQVTILRGPTYVTILLTYPCDYTTNLPM